MPCWNPAKSTTVYKPLPKPREQPQKQKSSDRVNAKKQSDGQNHKKAKRLSLIKPDSRRLSRRRRRERICLKRNLWLGPRNPSRMFRKRKWVSGLQDSQFQCLADIGRGLSDVEAGLRRSHGELQGRGGLVYGLVTIQLDLVVVLASCVPPSYAFQSFTFWHSRAARAEQTMHVLCCTLGSTPIYPKLLKKPKVPIAYPTNSLNLLPSFACASLNSTN